jgi:hypothetical protein
MRPVRRVVAWWFQILPFREAFALEELQNFSGDVVWIPRNCLGSLNRVPELGRCPSPPGMRRAASGHGCCKAIDNQSQTAANRSHDHLRVPGPQYSESERRDCGGRSLPCAGPQAPLDHDKLRKMLRNRVRDDP